MGLIDTSVTTNSTLAKGMTNVTAAQAVMNKLMPKTSSAVMGALSKGVSTAIGTVGGAVGLLRKEVGSTVQSGTSSMFSGIGSFFSNIDSKISQSASGLFTNTTDSTGQNIKDVIPSATTSSFAKGTPNSKVFSTNKMLAQTGAVNLSGDATSSSYDLSKILGGGVTKAAGVVAQRLGLSTPTSVTDANNLQTAAVNFNKSGYMNGQYEDLVNPSIVSSAASSTESSLASTLGLDDYQTAVQGLATSLTGDPTGLNGYYDSSLPQVVKADGTPVDSNGLSASQYTNLSEIMRRVGCGNGGIYNSYSSQLSGYNMLMQIAGATGSQSLMTDLLDCNLVNTPFGTATAANVFKSTAKTMPGIAETIINALGPSTVGMNSQIASEAVQNQNASVADATSVKSILNTAGISVDDVFSSSPSIGGNTVYDTSKLSASSDTMLNTLFGTKSGVPSLASAKNTLLSLTSDGKYTSLIPSTLGSKFNWVSDI